MRHVAPALRPAAAYRHCRRIATAHYENFTVGSWLLPRRLRRHLAAIYAFSRAADDIADEGTVAPAERLARLAAWEAALEASYNGKATDPVFVALADTATRFDLPIDLFRRLLGAFRRDVDFRPFPTFAALLDYCACSANPVGRLILHLFGYRDAERQQLADQICTGLQLANFWQDISIDAGRGRLYVPREDLERFGITAAAAISRGPADAWRRLLAFEVSRSRDFLSAGLCLADLVEPRLAREVRLFVWGGLTVLAKIEAAGFDVLRHRPTLSKADKSALVAHALLGRAQTLPRRCRPPGAATTGGGRTHDVGADYAYCREVTRRSSSNFYYAFRLLAPERRAALWAVYAFCRFVDDVADEAGRQQPQALLDRWRGELDRVYGGAPTHPIGRALADAVKRFPLEQRHFSDLIRGVEMDLTRRRYATFDDLYAYCYLVASTVGLLCIDIFGCRQPGARDYAQDLGVAFQLTNILRDVPEDARRGRIYLPLEDLGRFGCVEEDLLAGRYSARVGALMAFECGRARAYYLRARGALAPGERGALAAAEAMRLIYERLLDRIEARHFDVFGPKVTLPRYQKLTLALAAWGRSQLTVRAS